MNEEFLYQDIYQKQKKSILNSTVAPLTCYVCKKELNGISITAKMIDGKTVFLCAHHYMPKPYQIAFRKQF